jgi:hypothetical protein
MRFVPRSGIVAALSLAACAAAWLSAAPAGDNARFSRDVYPILREANCRACHTTDGVASATRVHFPAESATDEVIESFGTSLRVVVDREDPARSLLLTKPTNRMQHTGGQLIVPGSAEEKVLAGWVNYLARVDLPPDPNRGETAVPPGRPTIRRLTHSQYNNTVRDLLGDQTTPADRFPGEDYVNGFRNQALAQSISPVLAEAYSKAAEKLARSAFRNGDAQGLVPCKPAAAVDKLCAAKFVRAFGKKAFRRPLGDDEAESFARLLLAEAEDAGEFVAGVRIVVEAMLQSPDFLFVVEQGGENTGYELAARLSYFLWDTMPDAELFRAASTGEILGEEGIDQQARRMLGDPRARQALDQFIAQWLRFDRVLGAIKDAVLYKEFTPQVSEALTEETRRFVHHLIWNDRDFMEFFTADYTFVNSFVAELYEIPQPQANFAMVSLPVESGRAGILGQGSFLTQTGKPDETSPTERGLFVREHFLCQHVPPPPPNAAASLPPLTMDSRPLTTRERLVEMHLKEESCQSCHRLVDPIGFGLEKYDTTGRKRDKQHITVEPNRYESKKGIKPKEYDLDIDTSASVAGIAGSEFSTPGELGKILADQPACQKCIVKQLFRYAFGRLETGADDASIDEMYQAFRGSRFRFQQLIISLVKSDAFRRVGGG